MSYILLPIEDEPHSPSFVEALKACGVPADAIRVITPDSPAELITDESCRRLAAEAAGILLPGGPDLEPWRFGEEPLEGVELALLPKLDAMELAALAGARERKVPIWGICRGLQTLNVFFGGTLYQDLPLQLPSEIPHSIRQPRDHLAHTVEVTRRGNPLGEVLASEPAHVNSRHHQAPKDMAAELETVALSPDGVVEAAVGTVDGWWIQAVQWHPENLLALPQQRALWDQFLDRVNARATLESS